MNIPRLSVLAICFAVGLTAVSEPADAKWKSKKNKKSKGVPTTQLSTYTNPKSLGYPNGRPFQALESDFNLVKDKLYIIDGKVDDILADTYAIMTDTGLILQDTALILEAIEDVDGDVGDIGDALDDIADDVSMLKNTLEVQVTVKTIDPNITNLIDEPVVVFVQVIQNGVGVSELRADDFMYINSFPADAAQYCGELCFTEGAAGHYAIQLVTVGDWEPGTLAGTLAVKSTEMMDDGEVTSNGVSQVVFEIPVAPVVEP